MSRKKRFHSMRGKGAELKGYAFFHAQYPYGSVRGPRRPAPKSQTFGILGKETAPGADNTLGGKGTQQGS